MSRNAWKNVIGTIFVIAFLSLMQFGPKLERKHYADASMVSTSVENILDENGICQKNIGCKGKILFLGSNSTGFNISVYGVTDPNILQKIVSVLEAHYKHNDKNLTISFSAYNEPFELSKDQNAFMEIAFKGKEK